jgi:hypothetical protein
MDGLTDGREIFSDHPGGAQAVLCDNSTHFVSDQTDVQVVAALSTRDGRKTAPSEVNQIAKATLVARPAVQAMTGLQLAEEGLSEPNVHAALVGRIVRLPPTGRRAYQVH